MDEVRVPIRYLPKRLTKKDKKKQVDMLMKSRRLYKKNKYYTRKKVGSYESKTSQHIINARKTYKVNKIKPSRELSKATGCSIKALKEIVKKGEGAYYSSGSRPNQTGRSWGLARLASAITGGKSAAVDYKILDKGCDHRKRAFKLAKRASREYKYGQSKSRKTEIKYKE